MEPNFGEELVRLGAGTAISSSSTSYNGIKKQNCRPAVYLGFAVWFLSVLHSRVDIYKYIYYSIRVPEVKG